MPSAAPDLGYGRHPTGDKPGLLQTSMRWACESGDVSTRRLSTVGQDLIAALAVAALARVATPLCGLSFKPAFVVFPHSANLGRVRILTSTFCSPTLVSACMPTPALFSAHFQLRLRPPPPGHILLPFGPSFHSRVGLALPIFAFSRFLGLRATPCRRTQTLSLPA